MSRCLVLAACGVVALGCSPKDERPEPVGTTTLTSAEAPPVEAAPAETVRSFLEPEPEVTRAVEVALAEDPELSMRARNVSVTVERGYATLRGSVVDHATRDAVADRAGAVPGIVRVYNEVQVLPLADRDDAASDDTIAFSLQRALASEPTLAEAAPWVTIDVERGQVTLRGAAPDAAARLAVERLAETTPGVASVRNELRVEVPQPPNG